MTAVLHSNVVHATEHVYLFSTVQCTYYEPGRSDLQNDDFITVFRTAL